MKEKDFVEYSLYLVDPRKLKRSTQASYLSGVRGMWRWLYRQGLVSINEDIIPIPKSDDKEHYPFVLPQEVKLMLSYFDEFFPDQLRDKTIIKFLNATGLRIGEMLAIDVSQIDLDEKKAVEHDVHPRYLQKMLGHAKLNTTMFYMGVADGEFERIYRTKMEQS